jgi:hypothetical protein
VFCDLTKNGSVAGRPRETALNRDYRTSRASPVNCSRWLSPIVGGEKELDAEDHDHKTHVYSDSSKKLNRISLVAANPIGYQIIWVQHENEKAYRPHNQNPE